MLQNADGGLVPRDDALLDDACAAHCGSKVLDLGLNPCHYIATYFLALCAGTGDSDDGPLRVSN